MRVPPRDIWRGLREEPVKLWKAMFKGKWARYKLQGWLVAIIQECVVERGPRLPRAYHSGRCKWKQQTVGLRLDMLKGNLWLQYYCWSCHFGEGWQPEVN